MPEDPTSVNESAPFGYEFGPFRLNVEEKILSCNGSTVPLTPKVFDVLLTLVKRHDHVVSKEQLMHEVWGDSFVEESNLTQDISVLRRILGDRRDQPHFIQTLPKRGYRFVAPVKEIRTEGSFASGLPQHAGDLPRRLRDAWPWISAFTAVTVAVSITAWLWTSHQDHDPPVTPRISAFTSSPGFETGPAFSPDGRLIAFAWDKGDGHSSIYVKLIGSERPLRLTNHPGSDRSPVWSPDGGRIAFARRFAGEDGIFCIPALGGAEQKLLSVTWENWGFSYLDWSPDGKLIAFSERDSEANSSGISLLTLEGLSRRQLTSPSGRYAGNPALVELGDLSPAFSPDGRWLAFVRRSASLAGDIFLASVLSGEVKRLTFDNANLRGLAWMPDGRSLVFSSSRGGQLSLWQVSAPRGSIGPLPVGEYATQVAISRRHDRLAYTRFNPSRLGIWTTAGNFGPPSRFLASTRSQYNATFSPDGTRVTFESERSGSHEIWRCESDGSNLVRLTNFGGPLTGTPRWSPDGTEIAFDSRVEGNGDIYVISAEGGVPRRLTTESSEEMVPSWSRDGRWIYFGSNRSRTQQIWRIPAAGGEELQVTTNGGFAASEASDGRLYFVKSDHAGIWSIPPSGGTETLVIDLGPQTWPLQNWSFAPPANCWGVTEKGIYFMNPAARPEPGIEFFDFDSKTTKWVVGAQARGGGISVSPDGRTILYSVVEEQSNSDIMLVEDFR